LFLSWPSIFLFLTPFLVPWALLILTSSVATFFGLGTVSVIPTFLGPWPIILIVIIPTLPRPWRLLIEDFSVWD
jgi:hypothetical protein